MYRTNSLDRSGSVSSSVGHMPPPLSPSDSCVSISSFRPSLVWLFNHIRHEGRENLIKEDLRQLLGASVDNAQLNEAFEHLDVDGDGEISLDEFIGGFARFWKEAPHTPGYEKLRFTFPGHPAAAPVRAVPERVEEHYEGEGGGENHFHEEEAEPSDEFKRSLVQLSSHNRHSIETLWKNLRETNPELLVDFEDFVSEIAEEVQGAQRALDKQRRATRKEVRELEELVESELKDARTTLNIQTAQIKQQVQSKLEQRLVEKETELLMVRGQLDELASRLDVCTRFALQLESEVAETLKDHAELEKQCLELDKEKRELKERLEISEKQLLGRQEEEDMLERQAALKDVDEQREKLQKHEAELLRQKKGYEEEISKLKAQVDLYMKQSTLIESDEEVLSEAQPDLLANTRKRKPEKDSLMEEIVQKEGKASPLLRREQLLEPSPFQHSRCGSFVARRRKPQTNLTNLASLTLSLPNLADADAMEQLPKANRNSVFIPVYVNDLKRDASGRGSEEDISDHEGSIASGTGSGHMAMVGGVPGDDLMTQGAGESPPCDNESDIGSNASVPLEETEYFIRCKPIDFIESLAIQPDYVFKILVVGNSYVGKSSFLMRLCTNAFSQRYASTIGVDFYSKALELDGKIISLQLWDTAGQERFQSVTKAYYRGAQGIILVYDISQEESFIAVKSWISTIQDNVEEMPGAMMLVGNKVDLEESSEREVSTETGETFAKIYGAEFIETSAKTGYNVGTALLMLVRSIKSYYESRGSNAINSEYKKTVELKEQSSGSKCCSR